MKHTLCGYSANKDATSYHMLTYLANSILEDRWGGRYSSSFRYVIVLGDEKYKTHAGWVI